MSNLTLRDVEAMQADIAAGKSARGKKAQGRGGRSIGGASVAARAISTFRALLGHTSRGVTQRYVHLDAALAVAADQVSAEIAKLLDGESKSDPKPTPPRRKRSLASSDAGAPRRSSAGSDDVRPSLAPS